MATKKKKKRQKRKLSSARKLAETQSQGFQHPTIQAPEGVGFLRFQSDGIKRLDILPYVVKEASDFADEGDWHFEKTFWIHRIGANGEAHVCPQKTIGKKCPICEEVNRMKNDPEADEKLIASLFPKQRQIFYCVDHDEPEKGAQIWDMSYFLFGKKLNARIRNSDEDDDYDTFFDPDDGMILKIGLEEKSFGSFSFYEVETIDFKKRKDSIDPELYEDLPDLSSLVKVEKYEKLKSIFFHEEDEDEEEDESEEDRLDSEFEEIVSKPSSAPEDEDEEDDDDDDDDDDWDDD